MIAVITILAAFPLGYFMRTHLAANTAYAIAYLWAFTYQAVYLLPDFLDGLLKVGPLDEVEVGDGFPLAYGIVTLSIFVAGFGLVALGHRTRQRRVVSDKVAA